MLPDFDIFSRALEQTWRPENTYRVGPWVFRKGAGGGQRVSATTAEGDWTDADLDLAEREMRANDQVPLFMIQTDDTALDAALDQRGYQVVDPVNLYAAPVAHLTADPVPLVASFLIWPPLAIMHDLWAAGGIGPARFDVMNRVSGPKTAILARQTDRPAGVGFVAMNQDVAMIHAIEVAPALRQQGVGRTIMRTAGHWSQAQGARWLGLAVTRANTGANALYVSMGMQVVGHYHYRKKPD